MSLKTYILPKKLLLNCKSWARSILLFWQMHFLLYCNRLDAITGLEREIVGKRRKENWRGEEAGETISFVTTVPELTCETNSSLRQKHFPVLKTYSIAFQSVRNKLMLHWVPNCSRWSFSGKTISELYITCNIPIYLPIVSGFFHTS